MEANQPKASFLAFTTKEKSNRILLWVALGSISIEWIVFKLAYPFPDFFSDSYGYIDAASRNLNINIWPIGYSKFLTLFHKITYSDLALVTFQFLILEAAALYLFYTMLYWLNLGRATTIILFIFLFTNPLFLYISNYVSTDALFCALSIIWFTELIWILTRPQHSRIWLHTVCVFILVTFRYNAAFYPVITLAAYLLSRQRVWIKWLGSLLVAPLLLAFWLFSQNAGRELTGTKEASILGGWQLANNALYIRGQIEIDSNDLPSQECKELDGISRTFFIRAGPRFKAFVDDHPGNYFIQSWHAPLKIYMTRHYPNSTVSSWAAVSPLFATYGRYVIRNNPLAYGRYFILPNIEHYVYPSLEKLSVYNMGQDSIWNDAVFWFHFRSPKIRVVSKDLQGVVLQPFTFLFGAVNLFFLAGILWTVATKRVTLLRPTTKLVLTLVTLLLLFNLLFSLTAGVIVLRYQFFPMILVFCFFCSLYEYLESWMTKQSPKFNSQTPE